MIDWREEVEPLKELAKHVGLCLPLKRLSIYHTTTIPPKKSTLFTKEDNVKGEDTKLRVMEGGGISDQLSTDFVSRICPPNVTFQVTIFLVLLQLHKCTEYVPIFVLVLNPQVDHLEVQISLTIMVFRKFPKNRDVGFLRLF